jgi:putative sulfotransferase
MDRFVVGTGRCGSTLLSRMLAEHPSVLCLFEFFNGLDMGRRFGAEPVTGREFAEIVSGNQPFVTLVLSRGYDVPEITYPFGADGARYRRDGPLPYILVAALSRVTDDPDALFDALVAFASELPRQPLSRHYRRLFDWMTERMGRRVWIEKSGSSIDYLGSLHAFFPKARFLHLHRDGHEAALSMREHAAYRLAISLLYGLHDAGTAIQSELVRPGAARSPRGEDPIARILEARPSVEYFGRYWSEQIVRGHGALPRLGSDQYLAVRFEDLVAKPREVLPRIAEFLELDANARNWVERAAALVRGVPPTRFEKLSEPERERLAEACHVGQQLLERSP